MELTFQAGSWWSYLAVFLAAATPLLEVLIVVPAGVLAGMPPVPTALAAVAGNFSTVAVVVTLGERMLGWWHRRRPEQDDEIPSRRAARARDLARRWGVPGLALIAPLLTGTHVAAIAALATGSDGRRVLRWMTAGIVVWSAAVAAATVVGLDVFT